VELIILNGGVVTGSELMEKESEKKGNMSTSTGRIYDGRSGDRIVEIVTGSFCLHDSNNNR
jgi:hypothetical protein